MTIEISTLGHGPIVHCCGGATANSSLGEVMFAAGVVLACRGCELNCSSPWMHDGGCFRVLGWSYLLLRNS